jgi:hypothetical protein
MKVIKLKDLLRLVEEVSSEYLEMAYKPKGVQKPKIDPKTGQEIIKKSRGFWKEGNDTEIPDYWILNPKQQKDEDRLIVPLDCNELQQFINENSEWLNSIGAEHKLEPLLVKCSRTKYAPRNIQTGTSYVWSGERMEVSNRLKRQLNDQVEDIVGSEEVSKKLEMSSVPEIKFRDRKHLNRYGQVDNEKVKYETHTFNSYLSSKQFLKFVTARITGKNVEDEFKSYHLARQFNGIYNRWFETKKNDVKYEGKTPAYMLEKFGLDENNLDVTVRTDFKIEGINDMQENKYTWKVTLQTKFGRKLTDDTSLGKLDLDREIVIGPKVYEYTIPEDKDFLDSKGEIVYTVLDNFEILNGLIECLEDMKSRILAEFKPIQALKLANIKNFQITNKTDAGNV